jgi:hypothetical protein
VNSFRRLVAAVTGAHFVVGFWVATSTPGPLLSADDVGYLGLARTLAGNGDVPLPIQPPYGLLYPSLLAPGWAAGLDESAMLTYGRLLNAGLGAILVPLLYLLLRRITDTSRSAALIGAVVAASLPAAMAHSSIIWTETLLPIVLVLGLLALAQLRDRPTAAGASLVVVLSIAQVAAHPRATLAATALVGAATWIALRRRMVGLAVLVVAEAVVLLGMLEWGRRSVQQAAFGSTGLYDTADLVNRRGLDELPDMIVLGTGTIAYLVLATAAIAVIGGISLWRSGLIGRTSLAALGATVVMSGWFLIGVPRADKWLHGRYIEAVAAPLIAAGVACLTSLTPRRMAAMSGLIVAAGLFAAWAGPGDNWSRPRSPVMMLGVEPGGAPFGAVRFEPGAAALTAAVVLALFWVVARRRPKLLPLVMAPVLVVASMSNLRTLDKLHAGSVAAAAASVLADEDVTTLAIDPAVASGAWIAVAWEVGLDDVVVGSAEPDVSHMLLPAVAAGPIGAAEVGTVGDAILYRLVD